MAESALVPVEILDRLSGVCLALPETYEEPAWVGMRWRVRQHTFAHVFQVEDGRPAAFSKESGVTGPATILVFRAPDEEVEVLKQVGPPFFRASWGSNVVGMTLADPIDWSEIGELMTDSYLVRAPKKLAALVRRPR